MNIPEHSILLIFSLNTPLIIIFATLHINRK